MSRQRWFRKYPIPAITLTVIAGSALALVAFEFFLSLFLRFPVLSEYVPHFKPSEVYAFHDRNIIQFMPECAMYDSELTYTLKPGECDFCNREYCTRYKVNSLGLRDDEVSLRQPEIIVLGDSYAMGWGVEQDENFPQIIEKLTGTSTLNAGISSYATAREMILLRRLDLSRLKFLVVQYSNNDYEENHEYVTNGFTLKNMTKEKYELECKGHVNRNRYKPFLFTTSFLKVVLNFLKRVFSSSGQNQEFAKSTLSFRNDSIQPPSAVVSIADEAKEFLKIIETGNFGNVSLIVLNLAHYSLDSKSFIEELAAFKGNREHPSFIREMTLIDASSFLKKSDYYIIDDHLKTSGHQKVADAIVKEIRKLSE